MTKDYLICLLDPSQHFHKNEKVVLIDNKDWPTVINGVEPIGSTATIIDCSCECESIGHVHVRWDANGFYSHCFRWRFKKMNSNS